jgi:hypothetical protein
MKCGFEQMQDLVKSINGHRKDCDCTGCRLKIIQHDREIYAIAALIDDKDRTLEFLRKKLRKK